MIDLVFDELRDIGVVSSGSDFSKDWLGRHEGYYRSLRSKQRKPSMYVLVSCACRLQDRGDSLIAYGDRELRARGRRFKQLSKRCFDVISCSDSRAEYAAV